MSHSNHHQVAGYLRDTRNVSGYLRDTRNVSGYLRDTRNVSGYLRRNASTRYLVKERTVSTDSSGPPLVKYGVFDRGEDRDEDIFIAEYFEQENADAVANKLNTEDDTFGSVFGFLKDIVSSDIGQAFIAEKVGVTLTGKDAEVAASKSGELEALKKELAEKEAKKKKTTRNLMIGGGVLAAGGLAYLAMRRR